MTGNRDSKHAMGSTTTVRICGIYEQIRIATKYTCVRVLSSFTEGIFYEQSIVMFKIKGSSVRAEENR